MIIVRDVFSLKFGHAKEVKALMEESKKLMKPEQQKTARALFDLVGPAYTLVWELTFNNLAEWENEMNGAFSNKDWGQWYQKFIPHVEKSYREVFTVFM